jgi:hypothetical protein
MDKSGKQSLKWNACWLMVLNTVADFAEPMFCLAKPSCSSPATVPHVPKSLIGTHRVARARKRHRAQPHPRHVAAATQLCCSAAH